MRKFIIIMLLFITPITISAEWRTMNVSAYCDKGYTASGYWVQEGFASSDDLPLGTQVVVKGISYTIMDKFGGDYTDRLDIFMNNYDDCINFGRQTINVYVIR
jgi:3D (Asp-Asp-Asp) domain-containing protein